MRESVLDASSNQDSLWLTIVNEGKQEGRDDSPGLDGQVVEYGAVQTAVQPKAPVHLKSSDLVDAVCRCQRDVGVGRDTATVSYRGPGNEQRDEQPQCPCYDCVSTFLSNHDECTVWTILGRYQRADNIQPSFSSIHMDTLTQALYTSLGGPRLAARGRPLVDSEPSFPATPDLIQLLCYPVRVHSSLRPLTKLNRVPPRQRSALASSLTPRKASGRNMTLNRRLGHA